MVAQTKSRHDTPLALGLHLRMGMTPIIRDATHLSVYARCKFLKTFLAKEKTNGRAHPILAKEFAILKGLNLRLSTPIFFRDLQTGESFSPSIQIEQNERNAVKKAINWFKKYGGPRVPKRSI